MGVQQEDEGAVEHEEHAEALDRRELFVLKRLHDVSDHHVGHGLQEEGLIELVGAVGHQEAQAPAEVVQGLVLTNRGAAEEQGYPVREALLVECTSHAFFEGLYRNQVNSGVDAVYLLGPGQLGEGNTGSQKSLGNIEPCMIAKCFCDHPLFISQRSKRLRASLKDARERRPNFVACSIVLARKAFELPTIGHFLCNLACMALIIVEQATLNLHQDREY